MAVRTLTEDAFLADVASHQLTVIKDDGLYRHIRLAKPGTRSMSFDIITWPGYLAYTGDVGCFTFSRIRDMFEFFFNARANPAYWSEKAEAVESRSGIKRFSWDVFVSNLMKECENDEQREFLRQELKCVDQDEFGAVAFVRDFDNNNDVGVDLSDFFEQYRNDEYSIHYEWCCYALPWAIEKYNKFKAEQEAERRFQITFSIDGWRRCLSDDLNELRGLLHDHFIADEHVDADDIGEVLDRIICSSNSFNCVSVQGVADFTDLSDVCIPLIGDE